MFWSKKQIEKEPEYAYTDVPAEHREKFAELYDVMMDTIHSQKTGRLERYRFWSFVDKILPEVEGEVYWRTHTLPSFRRITSNQGSSK
jgi:hypothetical protein